MNLKRHFEPTNESHNQLYDRRASFIDALIKTLAGHQVRTDVARFNRPVGPLKRSEQSYSTQGPSTTLQFPGKKKCKKSNPETKETTRLQRKPAFYLRAYSTAAPRHLLRRWAGTGTLRAPQARRRPPLLPPCRLPLSPSLPTPWTSPWLVPPLLLMLPPACPLLPGPSPIPRKSSRI